MEKKFIYCEKVPNVKILRVVPPYLIAHTAIASGKPTILTMDHIRGVLKDDKWKLPQNPPPLVDCAEQIKKNNLFVPAKATRDAFRSQNQGFFSDETVVILIPDAELRCRVQRIFRVWSSHIFQKVLATSYKMEPKKRHHFLAYFLYHCISCGLVFFWVLAPETTFGLVKTFPSANEKPVFDGSKG